MFRFTTNNDRNYAIRQKNLHKDSPTLEEKLAKRGVTLKREIAQVKCIRNRKKPINKREREIQFRVSLGPSFN